MRSFGGGRYDGLSEALAGRMLLGFGFAIGEDRLVMSLPQSAESAIRKRTFTLRRLARA